jgi:lipoprotein-anchoring transpeptidase ErfK/SrfK
MRLQLTHAWECLALSKRLVLAVVLSCSACDVLPRQGQEQTPQNRTAAKQAPQPGDAYAFRHVAEPAGASARDDAILKVQVALDKAGFSPGVLDGRKGAGLALALAAFQASRDLPETGELDDKTSAALFGADPQPASWLVRIPAGFARGPFAAIPKKMGAQAGLDSLSYRNLAEKLAERFHTTPQALVALNGPGAKIGAGAVIRVPAIADQPIARIEGDERGWGETLASLGVAADQPQADHLVVDKSQGVLKAFDDKDRLIAQFPATMGSGHDPLPLGSWTIKGVSRNPVYHYNPDLFWDASAKDEKAVLKPGPNSPVGVVWIDLSKPHYGIHGTPEPQNIGHTESHGCIRLTNWDAARLAQMVKPGVKALFQN